MPTLEEYASDPDDMALDLPPAVQDPAANQIPAAFKGKSPALPQDFANEAAIPKAMRVAIDGSFVKPLNDEYPKRVQFLSWDTLYPIYIDKKRPQQDGGRRVNAKLAIEWPFAEQMAKACRMLGFEAVFEASRPLKTHPKDWENPGRVKVQLRTAEGTPRNSTIKNKRILLARICSVLAPHQPKPPAATESNPHPVVPIHLRLPANSPAISHGTLAEAINGGGPFGGMLGGMLGGGADDEEDEKDKVAKPSPFEEERKRQEQMAKALKAKKVRMKRR
ncbi:hypothetical protein BMF94_5870 [Rhodotorula taiwanensis]|uniref:Signal recognition particle, SRP19 subunit n=1 Tax=Rhodotorula taiwanensis TaxID=741276 RepID=A0A2S5B2U6_9BASI|nr:hypothetical protein BMF94_5870 [Rhodotorula taiwanensis]